MDISLRDGNILGSDVDFASTTSYATVAAGEWVLQVSADSQTLATLPINVAAGSVYSVLILDTPTGVTAAVRVDATAAGIVPAGGVETGTGGMAAGSAASQAAPIAALVSGLALLVLAWLIAADLLRWPRPRVR